MTHAGAVYQLRHAEGGCGEETGFVNTETRMTNEEVGTQMKTKPDVQICWGAGSDSANPEAVTTKDRCNRK
jgi:hypothetical protein